MIVPSSERGNQKSQYLNRHSSSSIEQSLRQHLFHPIQKSKVLFSTAEWWTYKTLKTQSTIKRGHEILSFFILSLTITHVQRKHLGKRLSEGGISMSSRPTDWRHYTNPTHPLSHILSPSLTFFLKIKSESGTLFDIFFPISVDVF